MANDTELEQLLARNENSYFNQPQSSVIEPPSIQTAEKSASLFDLIKMISKLVSLTMKDLNAEFIPDEGKAIIQNVNEQLEHPMITYNVISREPKGELKPRVRQTITEKSELGDENRLGEVYGQKFMCTVQFNIFASVYTTAEAVMERFEELMFTYTGYFKKNGVAELLFKKQLTDDSFDTFRQINSVRNLRYYVEVEKLIVMFKEKIKEVEIISDMELYGGPQS
jgi:hypothetical protein